MDEQLEQAVRQLVERVKLELQRTQAPAVAPAPPAPAPPKFPFDAETWIDQAETRAERTRRAVWAARNPERFLPPNRRLPAAGELRAAELGRAKVKPARKPRKKRERQGELVPA